MNSEVFLGEICVYESIQQRNEDKSILWAINIYMCVCMCVVNCFTMLHRKRSELDIIMLLFPLFYVHYSAEQGPRTN